jgi:predicted nucleic acid-binding Zn ribbon protein
MTTNSLQNNLKALQRLVAFAEGETTTFPVLLLRAGDGLVSASSDALKRVAVLTPRQIEVLQAELRLFLRGAAGGNARMIAPMHITLTVVTHAPDTPPKGRRARRSPRAASLVIDGAPRDVLFDQTNRVLPSVALEALQLCPACGKAFVKVTQKRFCSTKCQSRIYMRQKRADERAEKERFIGQATRTRRR